MRYISTLLIILVFLLGCTKQTKTITERQKLENFFKKQDVTILVTDSGLGGLSIAADVYERMKKEGVFKKVRVVFFNAQPHKKSGYNSMKTTKQKVQVFNNALVAMEKNFHPDILLIGCNTLSVLYDYTDFSKTADFPVIGIVKTGVDLIKKKLDENKNARVIIFATKTTVKQNKHKTRLMESGVPAEQIITQACPRLAGRIERGSHSDTTKNLVKKYVNKAIQKMPEGEEPLLVSYNCTHYGYVNDIFQEAFKEQKKQVVAYLDPNPFMADFMFTDATTHRYPQSEVTIEVVSQPELSPGKLGSIYSLIEPVSPQTAEALLDYQFKPDFFEWESIAGK